jgi:predicted DCC family thiol-disulfide oxidoreductase YuxK
MRKLVVIYDATCGFCVRCRHWLEKQPAFLEIECLWSRSAEAFERYPGLVGPGPADLMVVDDEGGVYRGAAAWLMCLYALREYREWSLRLASPALLPFAKKAFEILSASRGVVSSIFGLSPEVEFGRAVEETGRVTVGRAGDKARCTYCHDDAGTEDAKTCPRCRAILHPGCEDELGGCSTLGCSAASSLRLRRRDATT